MYYIEVIYTCICIFLLHGSILLVFANAGVERGCIRLKLAHRIVVGAIRACLKSRPKCFQLGLMVLETGFPLLGEGGGHPCGYGAERLEKAELVTCGDHRG